MKIGIMDSGIGGLTVLKECLLRLPTHVYLYYADSRNAPYGTKSQEEVYQLTKLSVNYLIKKKADIIVIACNTATSAAARQLREIYDTPIIGMEPALKPALALANKKRILVTATQLTLRQQKLQDLISMLDINAQVDFVSLTELVAFAETGNFNRNIIINFLKNALLHLNLELYGSVVLGCTHFPLFRAYFEEVFPVGTVIVDGVVGTVNRIEDFVTFESNPPSTNFFLSGIQLVEGEYFNLVQKILKMDGA